MSTEQPGVLPQVSARIGIIVTRTEETEKRPPLMDRTLRVLALAALVCLGLFFLLSQLPLDTGFEGSGAPDGAHLFLAGLPALLVSLGGQTTFAFCLGVGVAALVAAIQRRQRSWAVGLVALLLVAANGSYLVLELASLLDGADGARFSPFALVGTLLPEALAPLAALVYTIFPHPRMTQPVRPTPALE